jgi:hypothetical protein
VRFIIRKLAVGQVSLPVLLFSRQSHSSNNLHDALTRRTNGLSLETFRKAVLFRKSGALDRKVLSLLAALGLGAESISDTMEPLFNGNRKVMYNAFDGETRLLPLQL